MRKERRNLSSKMIRLDPDEQESFKTNARHRIFTAIQKLHDIPGEKWDETLMGIARSPDAVKASKLAGKPVMKYLTEIMADVAAQLNQPDLERASHEAYVAGLAQIIEVASAKSKEEWESLLDGLMRSESALRAAYYEGKPVMQFLTDMVKDITEKRKLQHMTEADKAKAETTASTVQPAIPATARAASTSASSDVLKRIQENRERALARKKNDVG